MDEILFAPPKKPWNDDSPVNTNKDLPWFSKWCEMDVATIHSVSTALSILVRLEAAHRGDVWLAQRLLAAKGAVDRQEGSVGVRGSEKAKSGWEFWSRDPDTHIIH